MLELKIIKYLDDTMRRLKLYISMYGTLGIIIGVTTLFLAGVLYFIGFLNIFTLIFITIVFNILQWLFAPYIIEMIYGIREINRDEVPWLHNIVEGLARKSGINKPKIMISGLSIPNAFAYGSPLTGNRIAVTRGLLSTLSRDEVEAVLGHEFGHIVHKDIQIMMLVSLLPALLYYIGRVMLFTRDDENRGGIAIFGFLSVILSQILYLFVLGLSRLREYYADEYSANIVENGARKLQLALIKIIKTTSSLINKGIDISMVSGFRSLFIVDPSTSHRDLEELELLRSIRSRKISLWENILELFSTHPNIVKRIRALDQYCSK